MSIWPPIVMLALLAVDIGFAIGKAGQPRAPYSPGATAVSAAVLVGLMWWGGFFAPLGL